MSREPLGPAGQVLLDFQSVMEQFLETERDVLRTYLSARALAPATIDSAVLADSAPAAAQSAEAPLASRAPIPERTVAPPAGVTTPSVAPVVPADPVVPDAPGSDESVVPTTASPLVRLSLRPIGRPAPAARASLAREHTVLITDDGRGIADGLAERLGRVGYPVAILRTASTGGPAPHVHSGPLDSLADVEQVVERVLKAGRPIGAVVHLLPLSAAPDFERMTIDEASARVSLETRSLFLLAKVLKGRLHAAAADGGAAVIAVTSMGGSFGTGPLPGAARLSPGQGGVVGFTKCLALEWPQVRVRAVDLDASESPDVLAGQVFDELWFADSALEIGYAAGYRLGLELVETPAAIDAGFTLPSDAVVLATGGARGITADVCQELAARYQPTFVLVGQTVLPETPEGADTAGIDAGPALKRALMARLASGGTKVTVATVEKTYQHLLREREMRRNVGALTASGARVHYVKLDIRDDEAFAALIAETYATYGRLDGVIHGAGIIEDKLVQDKAVDSFDRVLQTKTRSAFTLSRCVRPESLRFAVFFSSVAGRFGNRGQGDYAAANEIVNKLAVRLDRQWPARVCSINWAPWDKHGMVSPELKREFLERGVGLIDPAAGVRAFWEEIQQPRTAPVEVVIAASPHAALSVPSPAAPAIVIPERLPLMKHATRHSGSPGVVQYTRSLDLLVDEYLGDHRLDGRPVLPLAVAAEMMAEAAQATWPDLTVVAVSSLQLLKGIVLDAAPLPLTITVRAPVSIVDPMLTLADVEISTPSLIPAKRYRGVVELASRPAVAPGFARPKAVLQPFPLALADAYRQWTFHGPAFQRITAIGGIGPDSIIGDVFSPSAASGIRGAATVEWTNDPFVFDCALQMLLMWSRAHNDRTALPSRFGALRRFGSLSDIAVRCYVKVQSLAGGNALRSDVHFVGPDGQVRAVLEGMEASCSAALNRLAIH